MPMQLITPEGFTLLNGGPKFRRAFLDWGCFHNEPGFFTAWSHCRQRTYAQATPACKPLQRTASMSERAARFHAAWAALARLAGFIAIA